MSYQVTYRQVVVTLTRSYLQQVTARLQPCWAISDSESVSSRSENEISDDDLDELSVGESRKWRFVDDTSVELHLDDVETFLLRKARSETKRVVDRLMTRMYGKHRRLPSDIPTLDVMKVWLDPTVFTVAK